MSPVRLLVLAILFYIGYRLIVGGGSKSKEMGASPRTTGEETVLSDTLEEDPICKKLVPRQQAVHLKLDERTFYFCSEKCCSIFKNQQGEDG